MRAVPMITEAAEWYVQKGARVQGPFSAAEVSRFLLLGRVRRSDRVSRDGELWEPVTQVPELVPEELLDLESPGGWRRFLDARASGDERGAAPTLAPPGAVSRLAPGAEPGPDAGADAHADPGIRLERRDGIDALARAREEWGPGQRSRPTLARRRASANLLPWSLLCLTLVALAVVAWLDRTALPAG